MSVKKLFILPLITLLGCSSLSDSRFAMNSADCAVIGSAVTALVTMSPISIVAGTAISKAFCDAETHLVLTPPDPVLSSPPKVPNV